MFHDQLAEYYDYHPHAYGDKYLTLGTFTKMTGSSPRVWGQVLGIFAIMVISRIIPTRMGTRNK